MTLSDTLRQRAKKQNALLFGACLIAPKKEKTLIQEQCKRQWAIFKSRWKANVEYASSRGEFDCEVYELTSYDMPKIPNYGWQDYRSCAYAPDISILTLARTGRKVYYFLKKNGLSPELRVIRCPQSQGWRAVLLATWR